MPPVVVVPPPPPPPPPLQLTPILDFTTLAPIANQKWDGTQFVRSGAIIDIAIETNPLLVNYFNTFTPPTVFDNIVISTDLQWRIAHIYNARPISNFGNSCYFGVGMHMIYVMIDVREHIINTAVLPGASTDEQFVYSNIRSLLLEMKKSPKNIAVSSFPNYRQVKKKIMGNDNLREEDAAEFISKFISLINGIYANPNVFLLQMEEIHYHAITGQVLTAILPPSVSWPAHEFVIPRIIIEQNINATLEDVIEKTHRLGTLEARITKSSTDHIFMYTYSDIVRLPSYLFIKLDPNKTGTINKQHNNIRIPISMRLRNRDKTQKGKYLFIGMVIHLGGTINTGHYTALRYDNYEYDSDKKLDYLTYSYYDDDKPVIKHKLPDTSKYLDPDFYKKAPDHSPYILLYEDLDWPW